VKSKTSDCPCNVTDGPNDAQINALGAGAEKDQKNKTAQRTWMVRKKITEISIRPS
jgi:hypothetical protein